MDKTETLRVARGGVCGDRTQPARSADWWSSHYSKYSFRSVGFRLAEEVEDPKTILSASGSLRVFQGGSWNFGPQNARFSSRAPGGVGGRNLGVRLVEEIDEKD
jgi:formylglycine-generating enzyme required for sulfatase activity